MRDFIYNAQAARVIFGAGSLQHLEREISLLGAQRALILCTPEQQGIAEQIAKILGARTASIYPKAVMHVPSETAAAAVAAVGAPGAAAPQAVALVARPVAGGGPKPARFGFTMRTAFWMASSKVRPMAGQAQHHPSRKGGTCINGYGKHTLLRSCVVSTRRPH